MNSYLHLHTFFEGGYISATINHPDEMVKAEVAQLVEQLICNQLVGGSSPFFGSVLCSYYFLFLQRGWGDSQAVNDNRL
ncbi:MAG: hypothetical protein RLZZ543_2120 [Bacteroidota bacterium]